MPLIDSVGDYTDTHGIRWFAIGQDMRGQWVVEHPQGRLERVTESGGPLSATAPTIRNRWRGGKWRPYSRVEMLDQMSTKVRDFSLATYVIESITKDDKVELVGPKTRHVSRLELLQRFRRQDGTPVGVPVEEMIKPLVERKPEWMSDDT